MRATRVAITRTCAICERSLLTGEHPVRFSPDGREYVDVCPLCQEIALEHGWMREGSPTMPALSAAVRRRRSLWSTLLGGHRAEDAPVADEPILRRLSEPELAVVEAADLFNASAYRRTVASIAKSLGVPRASVVVLSGNRPDAIVTVAWEISWYQYRVEAEHGGHVRLEDRGDDPGVIDQRWRDWNAQVADDGQLTLV